MSMEEKEGFDPLIAANKPKKTKKSAYEPGLKNIVYDPEKDESFVLEDLPFGGNEGNMILEKGGQKSQEIAKGQTLPLINLIESGKKIEPVEEDINEKDAEE